MYPEEPVFDLKGDGMSIFMRMAVSFFVVEHNLLAVCLPRVAGELGLEGQRQQSLHLMNIKLTKLIQMRQG